MLNICSWLGIVKDPVAEMSDWFAEEPVHGNRLWWMVALLGGIVAALVIMIHFSSHGWDVGSTGNQQTIQVKK